MKIRYTGDLPEVEVPDIGRFVKGESKDLPDDIAKQLVEGRKAVDPADPEKKG